MKSNILLGTLVLLVAMAAMPTATASNFYFVPQDSTGTPGSSITVDLMLDVDTTFAGYSVDINFDNSIVDIPAAGVTYTWGSGTTTNYGTYTRLVASGVDTAGSTYKLATLTLDGQSVTETEVSALSFSNTILSDPDAAAITHTATDGTYTNAIPVDNPDIVVTYIDPSQAIFVDATNVFTVHVKNQGTAVVTGSFDVEWEIKDDSTTLASGTETFTDLNIDEEKTFDFEWKPTVLHDTTVSATADSGSAVYESDETNNDLSVTYVSGISILPLSAWGYGGDEPLTYYESGVVVGDLICTFGDSAYVGGYNNPWSTYTVNFDIGSDINQISGVAEGVGSGTVKEARLYMYYNWYRYPDAGRPADPEVLMTMTFNGNPISTDAKYEDSKGFASYSKYKYGTFAYDVTPYVTGDGTYQAVLSNAGEGDSHGTSIYGMALLVIYEDGSKGVKEYHIAEGHDLLTQYYKSSSTGRYSYHVIPEDATSTVDMRRVMGGDTNLFTITQAATSSITDMSRLYFTTDFWSNPWTTIFGNTGTDIVDVTSLKDTSNTVKFQDRGDGYSATNAILISEVEGTIIDLGPDQATEVGRHIMVPITAYDLKQFYGTVEMNLEYNPAKFDIVAVHSSPDSIVTAYNPENDGVLEMSAWNQVGVKGDVVLATVELEVFGGDGTVEELVLTVDEFFDVYGTDIPACPDSTWITIGNPSVLTVDNAFSTPVSQLGNDNEGILNDNGRLRHTGDDKTLISATVTDSGLGIKSVTVDLSAIGGSSKTPMSFNSATGDYEVTTTATAGIDGMHTFVVTATDNGGNTATDTTNELTVYRRGDVFRNNVVDMADALYIARYTVGLQTVDTDHFGFVGDVQPATDGDHTTNMGDALYIARYTVGLEPAP